MSLLSLLQDAGWVDEIPGKLSDRKTPLGELNWVFTAITDTIAWNSLPSALFQKLFRQDLLVASLFRNFLLADRLLRSLNCTPVSAPRLPPTHQHPLWQSWDLAAESCLSRLHAARCPSPQPSLGPAGVARRGPAAAAAAVAAAVGMQEKTAQNGAGTGARASGVQNGHLLQQQQQQQHGAALMQESAAAAAAAAACGGNDGFFREQLTAFEVWLEFGGGVRGLARPPEQLPVVLQVLLSQAHRLRALILLQRFLDLGPWAVNLALSVGIFPYVLKLLQAPTGELRQVLVRIWARILAFDASCRGDLVKDGAHLYFIEHLSWAAARPAQSVMAAFILAAVMNAHPAGQRACLGESLHTACVSLLIEQQQALVRAARASSSSSSGVTSSSNSSSSDCRAGLGGGSSLLAAAPQSALLRRWLCLCIAKLCWGFPEARSTVLGEGVQRCVLAALADACPEVRCQQCTCWQRCSAAQTAPLLLVLLLRLLALMVAL
jgi:regulatory associated protein of mTOR